MRAIFFLVGCFLLAGIGPVPSLGQAKSAEAELYALAIIEAIEGLPEGRIVLDFSESKTFETPERSSLGPVVGRLRSELGDQNKAFLLGDLESHISCTETQNPLARRCEYVGKPIVAVVSLAGAESRGEEKLISVHVKTLPTPGRGIFLRIGNVFFKNSAGSWAVDRLEWVTF